MAYNNVVPNGVHPTHTQGARRHEAHDSALDVGSKDEATKMRIRELEEENHSLAERTASASQRFADYENEIRVLRTQLRQQQTQLMHSTATISAPVTPDAEVSTPPVIGFSRFGSFMRKPSFTPIIQQHTARESELEASLAKEQSARIEAERKVREVNAEVEELSTTLFQQANDMVATERKENAVLGEKIRALEKAEGSAKKENEKLRQKVAGLEQRDKERKRRLEKLEAAQQRIDRVRRTLLVPR